MITFHLISPAKIRIIYTVCKQYYHKTNILAFIICILYTFCNFAQQKQ